MTGERKTMYRLDTFENVKLDVFEVKRIHRNTVVYMDDNGSEYKDDLNGRYTNWFDNLSDVEVFLDGFFSIKHKKIDIQKISIMKIISELR